MSDSYLQRNKNHLLYSSNDLFKTSPTKYLLEMNSERLESTNLDDLELVDNSYTNMMTFNSEDSSSASKSATNRADVTTNRTSYASTSDDAATAGRISANGSVRRHYNRKSASRINRLSLDNLTNKSTSRSLFNYYFSSLPELKKIYSCATTSSRATSIGLPVKSDDDDDDDDDYKEQIIYSRDSENNNLKTILITEKNPDGTRNLTTVTTTYFKNGTSNTQAYVETLPRSPERTVSTSSTYASSDSNELRVESGTEEITYSREGDNQVKTTVKTTKNRDGSIDKTTIKVTFFPDGNSHTDTYYETVFEENNYSTDESTSTATSMVDLTDLDAARRHYEQNYELKGNQYDQMRTCFDKMTKSSHQGEGFISKNLLKVHIQVQVEDRKRLIRADEQTIERAVDAIDVDADSNISFGDFIDFLYLFFSSKKNFKTKLVNILNGHSHSHQRRGQLNPNEAQTFYSFLRQFYSLNADDALQQIFDSNQTYKDFADRVYPIFMDSLFVKWI